MSSRAPPGQVAQRVKTEKNINTCDSLLIQARLPFTVRAMARSFVPRTSLPVLDATGAVALAQQIEAAANALSPKPPASVMSAVEDIATERLALQQVIGDQTQLDERPEVRSIDSLEDSAWSMPRDFLQLFSRLPADHPAAQKAATVLARVYGNEGLTFTQLPVDKERAAADTRMMVIKKEKLDKVICELGGQIFWDFLCEIHPQYVATVESAKAAELKPSARIASTFDGLKDALDLFIVRTLATVDRKKPETMQRAEALLAPIHNYRATHKPRGKQAPADPPVPPVTPIVNP